MFQKRRAALLKNCLILLHQLYTMTCLLFDILLISKLLSRIFFFTCCLNNNLYQGKRQMSKQSVSQQLFLNVKERLDYYRLPTTFPIQSTTLLSKLLHLLDHSPHKNNIEFSPSKQSEGLSAALRHQMGRLVKENNKLHQDLMCNRQEIQSLQHRLFKFQSNKASDSKQSNHLSSLQLQRQQQLLAQLHQVRFKYNQLTDFIHQDPTFEREYIKRLMKHKPIGSSGIQESKMKGQSNVHMQRSQFSQDRVRQLEKKIKNRENEILRLQNLIQYDGLNMNKIIKNYQDSLTSNKLKIADDKVNYLEESMDKIKKENKYMRGTNGSKEALRAEVQKCHKLIQSLKKENNQLKRNHKEQAFDLQKHVAENERKITNVKADRHNAEKEAKRKEEQLQELVKKLSFTEKELKEARQSSKDYKGKLEQAEKSNFDFVKKSQEQKVFYEYEIDTYKKKLYDLDAQTADLRNGTKRALHQKDILRRQSEIKTDSIINLEKIVAELLKKNSILADNTLGTIQSMKRNEDFEMKRQIIDLQQQLIYSQNERQQADTDKKTLQHRFTLCLKENDRLKQEYGLFRKDLSSKQSSIMQLNNDIDDLRSINKRYQTEISKLTHQLRQSIGQKQRIQNQLKQELQASLKTEKNSKTKAKDLEIRLSEQQGMLQITKIKLQEREERIKQLQRLLTETVDQSKNLSAQLTQFQMKNQQLLRQNHKLAKKYDETVRQAEQFRNTSFRNYELSINDNNNQVNSLKKKIMMHTQSQERVKIRYEQLSNLLNMIRREKELLQAKSLNLQKQNERLEIRLSEMQEIQRVLVIENENLRNLARRL